MVEKAKPFINKACEIECKKVSKQNNRLLVTNKTREKCVKTRKERLETNNQVRRVQETEKEGKETNCDYVGI